MHNFEPNGILKCGVRQDEHTVLDVHEVHPIGHIVHLLFYRKYLALHSQSLSIFKVKLFLQLLQIEELMQVVHPTGQFTH